MKEILDGIAGLFFMMGVLSLIGVAALLYGGYRLALYLFHHIEINWVG